MSQTLPTIIQKKIVDLDKWFGHGKKGHLHGLLSEDYYKEVKAYFRESLLQVAEEARKDTAEEIWQLLNELELKQPEELKTDNWRNWKYIRNTIVDRFGLTYQGISQLKKEKK